MLLRAASLLPFVCVLVCAQGVSPTSEGSVLPPATDTPAPTVCPAGGPIGAVSLKVRSPKTGDEPLPLDKIINLSEGDTVLYSPVMRSREERHGEVALVMVPLKRDAANAIQITDPRPADKPQEWKIDRTMSIVAYVYGPEGLSKKKVRGFLTQDDLLIAQLADYAEKTAQTEALIQALSDTDRSAASVNAALSGFASQYGLAASIDKTAPAAVQAQTLFATMNPQLATYDPLTPSTSARIGQTASLTTAAAALFFGSPIGLAAGGTAMLLDLRSIAFPGTQFRSSFAQPVTSGLNLCGQRTPAPPHTRVAYIWANRIPNAPLPAVQVGSAHFVPEGQKTPVPVEVPDKLWHYLDRARGWTMQEAGGKPVPIKVLPLANQHALELDLSKASTLPGDYRLTAYWDWARFEVAGTVAVRPLSDFKDAKLEASSQDRLLARSGKIAVTLEGADFEFVSKVEVKKSNDEFATAQPIPFVLPKGVRQGPQQHADVQINSADLDPGEYQLLVTQADNKAHAVPVKLLPNPPQISNLPIVANEGASTQHFILKGKHLGLLARLEAPGANFQLGNATSDESERNVTVQLTSDAKPGSAFAVSEFLHDRSEPLLLPEALRITGPLPMIASSKLSLPASLPVAIAPGEFPAGNTLTAMLDVKNINPRSELKLGCEDGQEWRAQLHIGQQTDKWSLQQLSQDQLFLSYDTAEIPAGCLVQGVIDNQAEGESQPATLARIVRLPQMDQVSLSNDGALDGKRTYTVTGKNLEMIEKAGWDQLTGFDVTELPTPLPGQGQRQSLHFVLPDPPAANAPIYIWLRGEKTGRQTSLTAPAVTGSK